MQLNTKTQVNLLFQLKHCIIIGNTLEFNLKNVSSQKELKEDSKFRQPDQKILKMFQKDHPTFLLFYFFAFFFCCCKIASPIQSVS